ncbi:Hsp33 family molecular chaperone HslO [Xanthomonadaceae bacterium JHOS43]|nr:Hsp33 family molecular chaperone HslO [Xanthomonadaceae bacterium JHOS43]MCX7562486.1 Hsp33 family molecular chaperone HslO [Xanthomonadaceae bacterium XH05]
MSHSPVRHDDVLHRFLIEGASVRGVLVRLSESWRTIRSSADYPPDVSDFLAQASAAVALFGGHTKVEGRLSLQLRGPEYLRTVFAEYRHPGLLRGLAHWREPMPVPLALRGMGSDALLAMTVETQPPGQSEPVRYQGLVDLDADSLAKACENYFSRSEQLPTRLILARHEDRAAGILLQILPGQAHDADAWVRVQALLDTLSQDELFDLPAETLLYRLFHEDGVRLLAEQSLRFGCTCTRERVEQVLRGIGEEEALAAIEGDAAQVTCEFCGHGYRFDRVDIAGLFARQSVPSNETPQ